MRTARVLAPAKINLFLHILGRRPDGYHLLDSLLTPITLYDELTFRVDPAARTSAIDVQCLPDAALGGATNLAHRAAALLLAATQRTASIHIDISKRIPIGTGLGGGSSDAAATLRVVNALLGAPLSLDQLAALGARLGADIPFFVHGTPARIGGVGEQVTPIPQLAPRPVVLCWDGTFLSTKDVYARVDLALTTGTPASNIGAFVSGIQPASDELVNDLEPAAAQIHPAVLSLKRRLRQEGALQAVMTGSGAAVFGIWREMRAALDAAERLRRDGLWAESVQTLATSPAAEL